MKKKKKKRKRKRKKKKSTETKAVSRTEEPEEVCVAAVSLSSPRKTTQSSRLQL